MIKLRNYISEAQRLMSEKKYSNAIELYKTLAKVTSSPGELGNIHHDLSLCYLFTGEENLALFHINLAISFHSMIGDLEGISRDLVQYAILEKDVSKASDILKKAVELSLRVRDYETLIEALSALTLLENNYENVLKKIDEAYKIAETLSSRSGKLMTLYLKARILYDLGYKDEAKKTIDIIKRISREEPLLEGEINNIIHEDFGDLYGY